VATQASKGAAPFGSMSKRRRKKGRGKTANWLRGIRSTQQIHEKKGWSDGMKGGQGSYRERTQLRQVSGEKKVKLRKP